MSKELGQGSEFDPATLRDQIVYSLEGHFIEHADKASVEISEDGMTARLWTVAQILDDEKIRSIDISITDMSDRESRRYLVDVHGAESFDDGVHDDEYIVSTTKPLSAEDIARFRTLRTLLQPTVEFEDLGPSDDKCADGKEGDPLLVKNLTHEDRTLRRYLRELRRIERRGEFRNTNGEDSNV